MLTEGQGNWSLIVSAITASLSKLSEVSDKRALSVDGKVWNHKVFSRSYGTFPEDN